MAQTSGMFVDAGPAMLDTYPRAFHAARYQLLFAPYGQPALAVMNEQHVDILATDIQMPGISGLELIEVVQREFPQIMRILVSGQPSLNSQDISNMVQAVHRGDIFRFVAKSPTAVDGLKEAVRDAATHMGDPRTFRAPVGARPVSPC